MPNRLSAETSPYLLQHQDNPVDWYPWGDEAFTTARSEDKPLLLSVGYSACHWCHVMEHESFSDPETAALMNSLFVNVKVDREERPDVDSLYMQAVQQMTGRGGWPMTVFLTPAGEPFYGGTYYPPEPRHGLPSFRQVLVAIDEAYRNRRADVDRSAAELSASLRQGIAVNPEAGPIDESLLSRAFHGIASRFDHRLGGFEGAPKFPQPMVLDFLLRYWHRTRNGDALRMVEKTLEAMARGGIYDHLGGGFHRYSVDANWLVPHFEKMLYDNALLARVYTRAYQATRRPDFATVAHQTLEYLVREMRSPAGGFYSSQDADSEGEEGRFYVWDADDIRDLLGAEDAQVFNESFGVSDVGNWEGHNILHRPRDLSELAKEEGWHEDEMSRIIERGRQILLRERGSRVAPGTDDKILTSWNALTIHAFAEAAQVFGDDEYSRTAVRAADFLLSELHRDGRLLRTWRDGQAKLDAYLEDHALLADALLEVYRATFDPRWVREAKRFADVMIEQFWSPGEEMFYDAQQQGSGMLFIRPRDIYDNATPSGGSAAAQALTRLARLTGETPYERIASRVAGGMSDVASRVPHAFSYLLGALIGQMTRPSEITIIGDAADPGTRTLIDVARVPFLPETSIAVSSPAAAPELSGLLPILNDREAVGGRATAFVCRDYVCSLPVHDGEALAAELAHLAGTP